MQFDEVSGSQAVDTENCRIVDCTGSELEFVPASALDRARFAGVIPRLPRGRGLFRGPLHVP